MESTYYTEPLRVEMKISLDDLASALSTLAWALEAGLQNDALGKETATGVYCLLEQQASILRAFVEAPRKANEALDAEFGDEVAQPR